MATAKNIIPFSSPRHKRVWACACGCVTYRVLEGPRLSCAACDGDAIIPGAAWVNVRQESRLTADGA